MTLRFSQDEQRFIVDDLQTDLLLTRAGIKLVEEHPAADGFVVVAVLHAATDVHRWGLMLFSHIFMVHDALKGVRIDR